MPDHPSSTKRAGLTAFRHHNFRLYWVGQVATNVGTWMQMVATGWLVLQITNSPAALGINATFQAVPTVVFALFGGVVGDRVDRFKLLVWGQAVRLVPDIWLAVIVASGHTTVEQVYLYSFVTAIMNGLTTPGRQAFVPKLVPASALLSAIALNSTVWQGAAVVGPSLAGVVLAIWGLAACFYLNVLSDLVNLFTLIFLHVEPDKNGAQGESAWASLLEGLRYLWQPGPVRTILLTITALNVFGRPYQLLLPVFAQDVFHTGPEGLGLMTSMPALGAVIASVLVALVSRDRLVQWFFLAIGATAATLSAFALAPTFGIALAMLVGIGACTSAASTLASTILQQSVDDRVLGRVYSLQVAGVQGGSKLGVLPAGFVAQVANPALALLGGAAFIVVLLVPALRSGSLRLPAAAPVPAVA